MRAAFLLLCGAWPALAETTLIDQALDRLYRHDFAAAHSILQEYVGRHPQDPLGYSMRAAAYLFSELDRLMILESEFFGDDRRILEKKKPKPDPAVRAALYDSIDKARRLSTAALAGNPRDRNALFAFSVVTGVQVDYLALVEKRQFASLSYARESQAWAVKLLAVDPEFYDAYVTTGISEYLLGSMPFFVRWFLRFDQAQGSKAQAVKNLEIVAARGRYFRPFARIVLAAIHLREKRLPAAQMQLAELNREFPENPLFKRELDKLASRRTAGSGGVR